MAYSSDRTITTETEITLSVSANELANIAGITPSTVYSLFDESRHNVSITTIKILCDGLEMSLGEFFSSEEFDSLEQEIE
ncbi:MAG: helix-turn-helix transcriptional regulator [Oscillospiraceae bacterium]|nr:helix-turn-helix transcriptional regulator [Oscillospiraceae bacterium]